MPPAGGVRDDADVGEGELHRRRHFRPRRHARRRRELKVNAVGSARVCCSDVEQVVKSLVSVEVAVCSGNPKPAGTTNAEEAGVRLRVGRHSEQILWQRGALRRGVKQQRSAAQHTQRLQSLESTECRFRHCEDIDAQTEVSTPVSKVRVELRAGQRLWHPSLRLGRLIFVSALRQAAIAKVGCTPHEHHNSRSDIFVIGPKQLPNALKRRSKTKLLGPRRTLQRGGGGQALHSGNNELLVRRDRHGKRGQRQNLIQRNLHVMAFGGERHIVHVGEVVDHVIHPDVRVHGNEPKQCSPRQSFQEGKDPTFHSVDKIVGG
mmetsp:Transcript_28936/g.66969  ORF Transcript_28936/g.66969 Transcript_28936/m.66969 type:complete len:319 (+) Transcript_28936:893-1849(+)